MTTDADTHPLVEGYVRAGPGSSGVSGLATGGPTGLLGLLIDPRMG